jgi:uncharacterized phage protein gp47/JayE
LAELFEEQQSEDYWRDLAAEIAEKLDVDNRQGSVFYDTQEGHIKRTTKFYGDLASIYKMISIESCEGEILDQYAEMDGLTRAEGTCSTWNAVFEGAVVPDGSEFMCGDYYLTWTLTNAETGAGFLTANDIGTETNGLIPGSSLVPSDNIDGLISAVLGEVINKGTDEEEDSSLRARWKEEKANPTGNSNSQSYKTWCENVAGVALARILPLWGGANTVKAVLISNDGLGVSEDIVNETQAYVDPIEDGYVVEVTGQEYTFGDGVGEGAANIGAHFLAAAALPYEIRITADIMLADGSTVEAAEEEAKTAFAEYFRQLTLAATYRKTGSSDAVVRMSNIAAILSGLSSIADYDYDTLKMNESNSNITVGAEYAAKIVEVVFVAQ